MYKNNNCGLYIHIPFCKSKCNYCDFYSVCPDDSIKSKYLDVLFSDISRLAEIYKNKRFDSLFIGGGTPSVIGVSLAKIVSKALNSFNFCSESEVSVEVNPESVTKELMKSLSDVGVNRVSMGVQSFNEQQLGILGRIHSIKDVYNAVDCFLSADISNYNIDLMFGLPLHSNSDSLAAVWENSVNKALELKPYHISAYSLTMEEHTPLYINRHKYVFPSEEQEDIMYDILCTETKKHGYEHYEISNYAKEGYECKHNLKYWEHSEYLGIGPGAHSYIDGKRFSVKPDINSYCCGNTEASVYENISETESIYERLITGLRLSKGILLRDFNNYYDIKGILDFAKKLEHYGIASIENGRFFLTEKGFRVSNTVINQLDNYRLF